MDKPLPPGIGFTPETRHTLLANRQSRSPESLVKLSTAQAYRQPTSLQPAKLSSHPKLTPSSVITPASRTCTGNVIVADCAVSFPDVKGSTCGFPTETSPTVDGVELDKTNQQTDCFPTETSPTVDGVELDKTNQQTDSNSQCNRKKNVRKGASLSFEDLEDDTIYAVDCKTTALTSVPDGIPKDLPRVSLEKGGSRGCFLTQCLQPQLVEEPENISDVYIQHSRATDSRLGDRFGATIKTIPTPGDKYFEHFFTTVEKDGVAEHMKIRPGDQLVLLNGTFLPDIGHSAVLRLFSSVPVDSRTRLSLILLRHTSKKKWVWIKTSAILVPEYHSEPAVVKPHFDESPLTFHEERHLVRLKVPGTCLFIAIADGLASLEVSESGKDVDKYNIRVWERCGLDHSTGRLSYSACIYRQNPEVQYQNDYLTIEYGSTGNVECSLKAEQQWFGFGLLGRQMFFEDTKLKKWLSCSVSNSGTRGTFDLSDQPYHFDSYPVHLGVRKDIAGTNPDHLYKQSLENVGVSPEGTDIDKAHRKVNFVSKPHGSLDNISSNDSGYAYSRQSSYALEQ